MMIDKDITPTSYCREADVFSYTLFDALGGASRLFDLGGKMNFLFNNDKMINKKIYNEHVFFSPFGFMGRAVFIQNINNKLENYSLLSIKPCRLLKRVVSRIPLFLPYKRLAKVLQILRSENTPETWRSAGQTLNSALNFPVWKLGKVFHGLIRRDINTDSLHIISHNRGAFHRSLPFFQFFNHIKQHE